MTQENKLYINSIGTLIKLDTLIDISTANVASIKVLKPDNSNTTWNGVVANTANTIISYTTILGDLNQAGIYKLQAYVETPTWSGRGETVKLKVSDNFS